MIDFKPALFQEATNRQGMLCNLKDYEALLYNDSKMLKKRGVKVWDQAFECSVFSMYSNETAHRHLLLLGGMGPLAGVYGAVDVVKNISNVSITLFQACGILERKVGVEVSSSLSSALKSAIDVCPDDKPIDLIVLCNSAHQYMHDVLSRCNLRHRFNFHSLIDSVKKNLYLFHNKKSIVLQTDFSAYNGLYASLENVCSLDDIPALTAYKKQLFNIIEGVKSFNKEKVLKNGITLFKALHAHKIETVLLGCTELPIAIEYLQQQETTLPTEVLESFHFINPLHLLIQELNNQEKKHAYDSVAS